MRRLPRARTWFLGRFLGILAALAALQALLVGVGVPLALDQYQRDQTRRLTEAALSVILDHNHPVDPEILASGPFLVFDAQGELVFTNRGQGRSLDSRVLTPVVWEGNSVGQVYTGETSFLTRSSHQRFLATLMGLFLVSLVASVVVGWVGAWWSARRLTQVFSGLEDDLRALGQGRGGEPRSAPFVELDTIGRSLAAVGRQLGEAEERQRAFLQDVSHDLRTPLAGLRGQLEALADGVLVPEGPRFHRMLTEVDALEVLIRNLSLLLRTEVATLDAQPFDWAEVVADLAFRYEPVLGARGVGWRPPPSLVVLGDRALTTRAAGNLVDNALEHAQGLTTIAWGGVVTPEGPVLWMENDGAPVEVATLERMFDRHWRGDPGRTRPGAGLGLAIVRSVATLHGGTVAALPGSQGGLRFELRLGLGSAVLPG